LNNISKFFELHFFDFLKPKKVLKVA